MSESDLKTNAAADTAPTNFIHDMIDEHNRTGRFGGRVQTRFPRNRTAICTSATPSLLT